MARFLAPLAVSRSMAPIRLSISLASTGASFWGALGTFSSAGRSSSVKPSLCSQAKKARMALTLVPTLMAESPTPRHGVVGWPSHLSFDCRYKTKPRTSWMPMPPSLAGRPSASR